MVAWRQRTAWVLLAVTLLTACAQERHQVAAEVPRFAGPASLEETFELLPARAGMADVRILSDNMESWAERWRLLDAARERLDVVYFIIYRDVFGLAFLGKLMQRARAGVKVRLLLDAHGTPDLSNGFNDRDYIETVARERNIRLHLCNPWEAGIMQLLETQDFQALITSNHDKILLRDQEEAIIGGRNISREYFTDRRDHKKAMVDLDVSLVGEQSSIDLERAFDREFDAPPLVHVKPDAIDLVDHADEFLMAALMMDLWLTLPPYSEEEATALNRSRALRDREQIALENLVIDRWGYRPAPSKRRDLRRMAQELVEYPRLRGALHRERPEVITAPVRILDSTSLEASGINQINDALYALLASAEREVVIQNPYIILTKGGMEELSNAGRRGVKVTLLTNSPTSSDSVVAQAAFNRRWPRLLARVPGMRIFAVAEKLLFHSKAGVFDGKLTVVGSYNLDPLSFGVNSEVVAVVWSEEFAAAINRLALKKIREGPPRVLQYDIERDEDGAPRLYPMWHPTLAGRVKMKTGPHSHVAPSRQREMAVASFLMDFLDEHPLLEPLM